MFPCLRGQETFVAGTFFASEKQKMFVTFFRNILFLQQMFPRLCDEETMFPQQCFGNNVSSFAGALRHEKLFDLPTHIQHTQKKGATKLFRTSNFT